MIALARRCVAMLAVLAALLAPALLFYQAFPRAADWRESIFGTLTDLLGPFVQAHPAVPVRVVAIDKETIKRDGPWPWTTDQLNALVGQLQDQGPRVVLMDSSDPSPTAPIRSWLDVNLDGRLNGSPALVQSAWQPALQPSARRLPLLATDGKTIRPTRVAIDAMSVAGASALRIEGIAHDMTWAPIEPGLKDLAPVAKSVAPWRTAPDGALRLLPPDAPTGLEVIPAWRLLAGDEDLNRSLKGAVVIVRHTGSTPASGAEWRQAQGLAQLVNGLTPGRIAWALLGEVGAAMLGSLIVSMLMVFGRVREAFQAACVSIVLAFGAAAGLFIFKLELFDPVSVSVFILAAFVISSLALMVQRALGSNAAAPPRRRERPIAFNGVERREVTALVCEIRDLDALTEVYRDSPASMTRLIGKVLGTAGEIVRAHRGTVESVGPSGLRAVFNAPGSDPRHAEKAAEAALAVLGRLDPLNETLEKSLAGTNAGFTPVQFSIGIDTGDAVIGDIGLKAKKEFSAFGPALDGAAQLAALSKTYGPAILVGGKTEELINRNFALLELDLRSSASSNSRSFFALLGNPVLRANPRFKALQEGFRAFHAAYRKANWEQASLLLDACAKLPGVSSKLIALYEQRLSFLKSSPPRAWSGVLETVE